MAEGIKLTALGKELESNLSRTNTFVYVVNDGQSYKIPIDDLIFDQIINNEKIHFNAVTSDKIKSGEIETRHLKPGFLITEDMFEDGTIGLDKVRIGEFTPAALKAAAAGDLADAIGDIEDIVERVGAIETDLSDGGANIFYGANPPQNPDEGDLWVDASEGSGNVLKRWNGAAWDIIQDHDILQAINAAGDAANLADKKISTFYANDPPQNDLVDGTPLEVRDTGDLWFDTDDLNKLYRFDYGNWVDAGSPQISNVNQYGINSGWVPVFDQRITDATLGLAAAITDISTLSSEVSAIKGIEDRGINTYYGTSEPLAEDSKEGDLWVDTGNGNKLYRYDATLVPPQWVHVADERITTAMSAATAAANLADGKAQTFFDSVPPTNDLDGTPLGQEDTGDLWFNTGNNNKIYRYDHSKVGNNASFLHEGVYTGWMPVIDEDIAINASNIADAVAEISTTVLNLSTIDAKADGYVHTFYQSSQPSTSDLPQSVQDAGGTISAGDLWLDTGNGNKLYIYLPDADPAGWTPAQDSEIQTALQRAQTAANLADNKVTVYWSDIAPTVDSLDNEPLGVEDDGDLWFDTSANSEGVKLYKMYRFDGGTASWILVSDPRVDGIASDLTNALTRIGTAEGKIATLEGLEDGGINSFYQATPPLSSSPTPPAPGDIWYDTTNNYLFRFTSQGGNPPAYDWELVQDGDIANSFAAALTAAELADKKATVFYGTNPPTEDQQGQPLTLLDNGDLWFDSSDNNRLYRFDFNTIVNNEIGKNSGWVVVIDPALTNALSDLGDAVTNISGITAREDGYVHSFYQDSKPQSFEVSGGLKGGDIWINTTNGTNKLYIYDTSGTPPHDFVLAQDQDITSAFAAAASAANTADGKISTYYSDTAPQIDSVYNNSLDDQDDGDLWFNTADGNRLYRFQYSNWTAAGSPQTEGVNSYGINSGWIEVGDARIDESAITIAQTVTSLNDSINRVSTLEARADGYVNSFYQDSEPTNADLSNGNVIGNGDIWIKTNSGNALYIYDDGWKLAQDQSIATAFVAATAAANTADGKITTYYGDNPPDTDPTTSQPLNSNNTGDLWVDQNNFNKIYRYDHDLVDDSVNSYLGTGWVPIYDERIDTTVSSLAGALTSITSLENITDGQVHTFYQANEPTNSQLTFGTIGKGDLWIDTDDDNKLYFYVEEEGTTPGWQLVRDEAITQAFAAAASAANTADGKITTFFEADEPTIDPVDQQALGTEDEGDLWFETDNNNKLYRFNGSNWVPVVDPRIEPAIGNLAQAMSDITTLSATIQVLSGAEDGGINTFYQDTEPSTASLGDLWLDKDGNNKLYRYSGTVWEPVNDQEIQTVLSTATAAANIADRKISTFYGGTHPTHDLDGSLLGEEDTGDLWINTSDNNKIHRYDHSIDGSIENKWVLVSDIRLDTLTDNFADTVTKLNTLTATVESLEGAEDGGAITFAQDAKPSAGTLGDLWVDTNDGNKLYRHNGTDFCNVADQSIQTAIVTAVTAGNTADSKIQTFYQDTFPSGLADTNTGDLFVNTSDNNTMYRYVHDCLCDPNSYQCTGWFNISDSRITTLGSQLTTAEGNISSLDSQLTSLNAKADGKITTFYQDNEPGGINNPGTSAQDGDLWIDKNGGNRLYIYQNNVGWTEIQDTAIAGSFAAALTAANTADSKTETFYQDSAPEGLSTLNNGDIWYDTSVGAETKVYIYDHSLQGNANSYNSTGWVTTRDNLLTQVNTHLADTITKVNTLTATVESLEGAADGGIVTFYQENQPTGSSLGDLWLKTSTGQLNRYNGTDWDLITDCAATNAVSIAQDAANVADGKITSFFQDDAPTTCFGNNCALTEKNTGDIWFDTNCCNKLYRFDYACTQNGQNIVDGWNSVQDTNIAGLVCDMADAVCDINSIDASITLLTQRTNGAVVTWYCDNEPSGNLSRPGGSRGIRNGDLWVDIDDGNRLYIRHDNSWANIQDESIRTAFVAATAAACVADGKIATYYCNEAPTVDYNDGTPLDLEDTGDLWFDTNDDNKLYRWDGNSWESVRDMSVQNNIYEPGTTLIDGGRIYTESICACSIKANAITADKIKARSINSNAFVAGSVDACAFDGNARLAGTIQSINFDGTVCDGGTGVCWGSRLLHVNNSLICSDPTVNPLSKPVGTSVSDFGNMTFYFNKANPNAYLAQQCPALTEKSYLNSIGWQAYILGGQNVPDHVCSDCFLAFEKRTVENSNCTVCQGTNPISTTEVPYDRWQLMRNHVQCNALNTTGYDFCNCNRPTIDYIWPIDFGDGPTPKVPNRICTTPTYSTDCWSFSSPKVTDICLGEHGFFLDGESGTAIFNTIIARDYSISGKAIKRRTNDNGNPRDGIHVDDDGNLIVQTNNNTINIIDGAVHLDHVPESLIRCDVPDYQFCGAHNGKELLKEVHNVDFETGGEVCNACKMLPTYMHGNNPVFPVKPWRGNYTTTRSSGFVPAVPNFHTGFQHDIKKTNPGNNTDYDPGEVDHTIPGMVWTGFTSYGSEFMVNEYAVWEMTARPFKRQELNIGGSNQGMPGGYAPGTNNTVIFPGNWVTGSAHANRYNWLDAQYEWDQGTRSWVHCYPPFILGPNVKRKIGGQTGSGYFNDGKDTIVSHSYFGYLSTRCGYINGPQSIPSHDTWGDKNEMFDDDDMMSAGVTLYQCQSMPIFIWDMYDYNLNAGTIFEQIRKISLSGLTLYFNTDQIGRFATANYRGGQTNNTGNYSGYFGSSDPSELDSPDEQYFGNDSTNPYGGQVRVLDLLQYAQIGIEYTWSASKYQLLNSAPPKKIILFDRDNPIIPVGRLGHPYNQPWRVEIRDVNLDIDMVQLDSGSPSVLQQRYLHVNLYVYLQTEGSLEHLRTVTSTNKNAEDYQVKDRMGGQWSFGVEPAANSQFKIFRHQPVDADNRITRQFCDLLYSCEFGGNCKTEGSACPAGFNPATGKVDVFDRGYDIVGSSSFCNGTHQLNYEQLTHQHYPG